MEPTDRNTNRLLHRSPAAPERLATPEDCLKFLRSLLNHNNPEAEQYHRLAEHAAEVTLQMFTPYSPEWAEIMTQSDVQSVFKEKLSGHILVNLGGQRTPLEEFRANGKYPAVVINVDQYSITEPGTNVDAGRSDIQFIAAATRRVGNTPVLTVKADLLEFMSRVQSGSANIEIDGIDTAVISDWEYHSALADEILRAVPVGGICFGNKAQVLDYDLGMRLDGQTKQLLPELPWPFMIFEKRSET